MRFRTNNEAWAIFQNLCQKLIITATLILILKIFLSRKCCLLITSVAYIPMHSRLILTWNQTMNPDQTAPKGAV